MSDTTFDDAELDGILATIAVADNAVAVRVKDRDIRTLVELMIVSIEPETPLDEVKEAMVLFNSIHDWVKDQKRKLEERLIPVLKVHKKIAIGPLEYWMGFTKPEWKCVDVRRTLAEVAKTAEVPDPETGEAVVDWSVVASCLSSSAFKPAATRKQLGGKAGEFFTLPDAKEKVESNAPRDAPGPKGEPGVQVMNTEFVR